MADTNKVIKAISKFEFSEEEEKKFDLFYKIRKERKDKGLTQQELAKIANVDLKIIMGIEAMIEKGCKSSDIEKICDALGIDTVD